MNSLEYTCKLCGRPGTAQFDPECVHNLEAWAALLHCDRCGIFKALLSGYRRRCRAATLLRWSMSKSGRLTDERDKAIQAKLADYTKKITELTGRLWSVEIVWTEEFVTRLIDFPDKAEFIVNEYVRMIQEQAQELHRQARELVTA